MKKITLILASLFISISAFAQFGYGPRVGMNLSTIVKNGSDVTANWRVGFTGGMFIDYRFNDIFALEMDALYSQQGVRNFKVKTSTTKLDFKSHLDYITVPILAKFYITENFNLNLGPQVSFLVNEKYSKDLSPFAKNLLKDGTNTYVMDMVVGAGYEFCCGIMLDVRYMIGLTHTYKKYECIKMNNGRNSNLQFTLAYRF